MSYSDDEAKAASTGWPAQLRAKLAGYFITAIVIIAGAAAMLKG